MGESQCPTCHHVTTGFEQQEFEAQRAMMEAKNAEIDNLRAALEQTRQFIVIACGDQAPYVKAGLAVIDAALNPS